MNLANAFHSFIGDPVRHRRPDLALYRISQLLHDRTNGSYDLAYMRMARVIRPQVDLPTSALMSPAEIDTTVQHLRRDGYLIMPVGMTPQQVDEIKSFAFSTPAYGSDIDMPVTISPDNIPYGEARYTWWMDQLVQVPAVRQMITEGPFCAIAQDYLGCRPLLVHASLYIDVPFDGGYSAYQWHYDNDGPGFLKFFFFLTDVAVGTGAHYYVAGSHAHTKPKSFMHSAFYDNDALLNNYGRDKEVIVRGPAGTALAEDTMGFHRGSTITHSYRFMMQFQFSVLNVPTDQELMRPLIPIRVPGIHPGVASIARKFYAR